MKKIILIVSLSVFFFHTCSSQKSADDEYSITKIENYLNASTKNGYSGSILIAKDDEILLSKGFGLADRDHDIPMTPQTIFNIGSVTKQFTAAAILKLMELEKLELSNKLKDYFPQVPSDKQDITIHQLLTHTSGISPRTGGFRYDEASKEQFLSDFYRSDLLYEPGTKHTYANANYILLAAIVEIISKQEYESFLREYFWNPINMNHTGYKNVNYKRKQLAHGYYFDDADDDWKDWGTTEDHLPKNNKHWYSIGKGDLYSTTEDLLKWHKALEQNKVLTAQTKSLMETAHVAENEENTSFYGYGWAIFNSKQNKKIVTHNGSNGIYFAEVIRFIEDDLVVIALSNVRLNRQSENIAWHISKMVFDKHYEPKAIPKNTYELIFDFLKAKEPNDSDELPQFIIDESGSPISEKAILNRIGFKQISQKKDVLWGIELLKLNTVLFPNDGNLWDSLGEGYYLLNDKENAILSFEKALDLRPTENCYWCENAEKRLEELKE